MPRVSRLTIQSLILYAAIALAASASYTRKQSEFVPVCNVHQIYATKNLAHTQDLELAWQAWTKIDGFSPATFRQIQLTELPKPPKILASVGTGC